ncbi:kinase-like domain-containing protein [Stachybotrys elegans]|uniref:non-specific serine/threonine protein kinase n=1 Tax=Stachybotrys elegans TaxID=80388 RepID=A0A8K0SKA5_9HYPO|nr:kinase-like domain-containing protein [Stachybotrys elegans]
MAERDRWTTVGNGPPTYQPLGRIWEAEQELKDRETIASWEGDAAWPGIDKPLFGGPEAKRFDSRLIRHDDLGQGAFGRVEKVSYGSVFLARKRIGRRRGVTIEDLRQEALTMHKLDHRHVVKLVATYAPRGHELCLLIWPAAVCNLKDLLEDIESLRLGDGDRADILGRFEALDIKDLSAIEYGQRDQRLNCGTKCPLEFLRSVIGCTTRALAYTHANGVRHLDIKPSNILLRADRVYLADFGISRDVSGQDQTTTDGSPGTERWRAPELYGGHGTSMQLSDIYSLGLVFLNIATVLYNARLADFDAALEYSPKQNRQEQLRAREEKLRRHMENLTAHALVTPPFMFTYEGQETVRPRPLIGLLSKAIATSPSSRLSAEKLDDKLSMLGGIHQIYHGDCCKRPISWVEDKWDRKFAALLALKKDNERLQRRVQELEGKDQTYEQRVEKARRARDDEVLALTARLKETEERCRRLEQQKEPKKCLPRTHSILPIAKRNSLESSPGACGLGLTKTRSTPITPITRPHSQSSSSLPMPRLMSDTMLKNAHAAPKGPAECPVSREAIGTPPPRTFSSSSLGGSPMRSVGSRSKIPLPRTPTGGATPPPLNRNNSLTDSSMASSIFSRQSIETLPTPCQNSPALHDEDATVKGVDYGVDPRWGVLPDSPLQRRRRLSSTVQMPSALASHSAVPSPPLSVASLSTLRSDLHGEPDHRRQLGQHVGVPSLQAQLSWAEVAGGDKAGR